MQHTPLLTTEDHDDLSSNEVEQDSLDVTANNNNGNTDEFLTHLPNSVTVNGPSNENSCSSPEISADEDGAMRYSAHSNSSAEFDRIRKEASINIANCQNRQKKAYDYKRLPAHSYSVGDLVKITKTNFKNDGKSKKLLPKFIGPFKIKKCLGNDRYEITNVPGFKEKKYETVVAADRMRPWINVQALEINNSSSPNSSVVATDSSSDSQ